MWEPFTESSLDVFRRAQATAVMFASPFVGTEHFVFVLAGGDDDVAAALAGAVDGNALKTRLGPSGRAPLAEMAFSDEAKRGIALAFEHARELHHAFIGLAHLALGMVEAEPPPLVPGVTHAELRAGLKRLAAAGDGGNPDAKAKERA